MKKTIIFIVLIALVCFLFCGCPSPKPETGQSEQNMNLPELQTDQNLAQNTVNAANEDAPVEPKQPGADETNTQSPNTDPVTPLTTEYVAEPVSEYDEDPELATASDFVVDGGAGFGFGGN